MKIERVGVSRTKDNDLVLRAQRGDRDAFALLIEPRAGSLLHTARAIVGDNWDAYEALRKRSSLPGCACPRCETPIDWTRG